MPRRRLVGIASVVVGVGLAVVGVRGVLVDDDDGGKDVASPSTTTTSTTLPGGIESPVDFMVVLGAALTDHDLDTLIERLHPAVIERYGLEACRSQLDAIGSPGMVRFTVTEFSGPESWTWTLDDRTTEIDGAYTVVGTRSVGGAAAQELEIHVAPVDREQRWFTDCGDPLAE